MINEQRVRLMTKMSIYRKRDGVMDERINGYFKNDYIGSQMLHTFISATLAYIVLVIVAALYNFEDLMLAIYSMDIPALIAQLVVSYLSFVGVLLVITVIVYSIRYNRAKRNLNGYYHDLKHLSASYKRDEEI